MPRPTGEKEATGELHPPFLRSGKVVSNRWKISHRLGAGTFGEVYAADDRELKTTVALKIELNNVANEEGLLKMEVEVLKELASRPHTPQLFASGKRAAFTYIVISRCGIDLHKVKKESGIPHLSDATVLRLAVHALYAMKQVHEIGYLHRDVKPSNMVFGATVVDSKILYLIDYGLARRYAEKDAKTGKWMFRKARDKAEVRGTSRYCSLNIHLKSEQSRADDMWAFVYSMIDLGPGLPWPKQARDDRVQRMKEEISDEKMLGGKLECFQPIMAHIRKMKFYDRPDYKFIYEKLIESLKKKRVQFEDPYDWEGKSSSKNTGSWQASLHTADGSDSGSAKESQSNRNLSEKGAKKNPTSPSPVPQYPTILTKHFEFQDSDVPSGDPKGPKMVPPSKRKGFVKKTVESEFLI